MRIAPARRFHRSEGREELADGYTLVVSGRSQRCAHALEGSSIRSGFTHIALIGGRLVSRSIRPAARCEKSDRWAESKTRTVTTARRTARRASVRSFKRARLSTFARAHKGASTGRRRPGRSFDTSPRRRHCCPRRRGACGARRKLDRKATLLAQLPTFREQGFRSSGDGVVRLSAPAVCSPDSRTDSKASEAHHALPDVRERLPRESSTGGAPRRDGVTLLSSPRKHRWKAGGTVPPAPNTEGATPR